MRKSIEDRLTVNTLRVFFEIILGKASFPCVLAEKPSCCRGVCQLRFVNVEVAPKPGSNRRQSEVFGQVLSIAVVTDRRTGGLHLLDRANAVAGA